MDDGALVERAKCGDIGAYEELVQRYQEIVTRTAYLITGDAAEAEDAAQEAFVKAYYALERFNSGAPFRPWLFRIVANEARNRRKATGRRTALALRTAEDSPMTNVAPTPESAVLTAERRAILLQALNALREDDRLAIAYRYFFDLSEVEMASLLGCARGTIKSRLSRALGRLRAGLTTAGTNDLDASAAERGGFHG